MTLAAGTLLGPYEVQAPIGAGGMGEVYRAKDTRLDRNVAVKVLPEHLAESPERKQRFEREAKAISRLSHPHICALYDVGHDDGVDYLVMEYLEGDTLEDKGRLPLDKVIEYGSQIAEALDVAHRRGIVHRDLKPSNVMLTTSGVKLLDFGLARAIEDDTLPAGSHALTKEKPLTEDHAVVGTLPYMAPEQLEGGALGPHTDIFALGAVLYEMATGKRAFEGKSRASLMAAIIGLDPPDVSTLRPAAPLELDRIIKTCLAKAAEDRWRSAGDVGTVLGWIADAKPGETRVTSRAWLWGGAGIAGVLAAWLVSSLMSDTTSDVLYLTAELPEGLHLTGGPSRGERSSGGNRPSRTAFDLSPDGARLAFTAVGDSGRSQLYLRRFDNPQATPIAGTDGAGVPFFSPDGRWVGYGADLVLYKVAVSGGLPIELCDTTEPLKGASWGANDSIVFARGETGLWRVSAAGGNPVQLTEPDEQSGELDHVLPHLLPDGGAVLFTIEMTRHANWGEAKIVVQDLATGERRMLVEGAADARYTASAHLLYAAEGVLMAAPFDLERRELRGSPIPVVDDVMQAMYSGSAHNLGTGAAQFRVSRSGTLAYASGGTHPNEEHSFVWVDRDGGVEFLEIEPGDFFHPRISPDGTRFVVEKREQEVGAALWVHDLDRSTLSRITFEGNATNPVWSPDGRRIAFLLDRASSPPSVFVTDADGSGEMELLLAGEFIPTSWSADGRFLTLINQTAGDDIWILPMDGTSKVEPVLQSPFYAQYPALSPDGSWLAYTSDETGRTEVYVAAFPGLGTKHQVSTDGGTAPSWASNGRELFYRAGRSEGRDHMVVGIETSPRFRMSTPRRMFRSGSAEGAAPRLSGTTVVRNYDVSPDARRFLHLTYFDPPDQRVTRLNIVTNWFQELERLVPTAQ